MRTGMSRQRKRAYRRLLYQAMLEIRGLEWLSGNPFQWLAALRRARQAGAVADWLHNLAMFSAMDFRHFDEARFWEDGRALKGRFPQFNLAWYEHEFDRWVSAESVV